MEMEGYTMISQNSQALIVKPDGLDSYEVWIRVERSTGKHKGELIVPTAEDFGVWAWVATSLWKADWIYQEITSGRRGFRPMLEANENENAYREIRSISHTFSRTFKSKIKMGAKYTRQAGCLRGQGKG